MKNYSEMSQAELDIALMDACFDKDVEKVKYLLESHELKLHASINANPHDTYDSPIRTATDVGSLEVVKYLMTKEVHTQDFHIALGHACQNGDLEIVKYFLLEHNIVGINDYIYILNETPLVCACNRGQVEVIDFLLNSSELKQNASLITYETDFPQHVIVNKPIVLSHDAFMIVCRQANKEAIDVVMGCEQFKSYPQDKKIKVLGNAFWSEEIEVIKYFLNHEGFDFVPDYENVFKIACEINNVENVRYFSQFYDFKESDSAWLSVFKNDDINPEFIKYLLIEKNWKPDINLTENIEKDDIKELIVSLLKTRELNESLEYNLGIKEVNSKKLKI